jgi:hypothetical protein
MCRSVVRADWVADWTGADADAPGRGVAPALEPQPLTQEIAQTIIAASSRNLGTDAKRVIEWIMIEEKSRGRPGGSDQPR